ncbi:hypothetical protein [Yersinia enterocolitica]|uniref:hypothetical protein n=1 Tax=Yersinia enterocolitica TaxID=630 RepID=UPI0005E1844F|nr:hypothetical protein [Yersinia enterocolitica]CNJ97612.1 Uncharacterised protein [Yersinia enterocolitica]
MTKQSNHRLVKERIVVATLKLGFWTAIVIFATKIAEFATAMIGLFNVALNYSKYMKFSFHNV